MRLTVRIEVEGSSDGTATLRVAGPEGVTGEGTFNVPCGTEERWVTITTSALPGVVKAYTPAGLSWSVQAPGETEFSPIGSTTHRIYVTLGTPSGDVPPNEPANRRLNFVCYAAAQAGTALQVIEGVESGGMGIHARLDADPPYDGDVGTIANEWRLMAGWPYSGECHHQAHFMNLAVQLIGVPAGREYLLRASTDPFAEDVEERTAAQLGITEDLNGDGQIGDEILGLYFDFPVPDQPPFSDLNAFEGTLEMPWQHYAVWPSFKAPSGCQLLSELLAWGAKQYWMLLVGDNVVHIHPTEVPGPTGCP
jgi:hypothetical protein